MLRSERIVHQPPCPSEVRWTDFRSFMITGQVRSASPRRAARPLRASTSGTPTTSTILGADGLFCIESMSRNRKDPECRRLQGNSQGQVQRWPALEHGCAFNEED